MLAAYLLAASHSGAVWWIVAWTVPWLLAAGLGALLCTRVPGNTISWLLLLMGLSQAVGFFLDAYSARALGLPGRLAAGAAASQIEFLPVIAFVPPLLLLFPDGHLASPRWRPVARAWAATLVVGLTASTLQAGPGLTNSDPSQANPYGLQGELGTAMATISGLAYVATGCLLLAAAVSLVGRYRRARGDVRQQLKWFALGASSLALAAFVTLPMTPNAPLSASVWVMAATITIGSIGIAVLRHRLYEIDVIIRRTLVYASLIGLLAALYLGGIFLSDRALQAVTGQSSALAVTISTLVVAAAFQPLRTRIQRLVDRRFYRAKYDANRTLEAFASRLRDQLDLDALHSEVLDVVRATVQPRTASLWLRPAESPSVHQPKEHR